MRCTAEIIENKVTNGLGYCSPSERGEKSPLCVQNTLALMEVRGLYGKLGLEDRDLYNRYPRLFNMSTLGQLVFDLNAMALLRDWQRGGLNVGETPKQIANLIDVAKMCLEHPVLKKLPGTPLAF